MALKLKDTWRLKLHEIIYEADTPAGKLFDILLFVFITLSIVIVMLESVEAIDQQYHYILNVGEWCVTLLFTVEYLLRLICVKKPIKYITSFYGIIDLLSIIPKYLSFFIVGSQSLVALRALRLLRIFRILKLTQYVGESTNFVKALRASRTKIMVFLFFVLILCVILGTLMYLIESDTNTEFTSIPRGVYWAIVTLTTVGYGDIKPLTTLGQFIAAFIMILGYGIIAIPTGIVTSEMVSKNPKKTHTNTQCCPNCAADEHKDNAKYCHSCGAPLHV